MRNILTALAVVSLLFGGAEAAHAAPSTAVVSGGGTLFEFHSAFWMNLHHVLHEQARRNAVAKGAKHWGPSYDVAPDASALTEPQRKAWTEALDYYEHSVVGRDLLFDSHLYWAKHVLSRHETVVTLEDQDLAPGLRAALNLAAPVYRATAWPAHDAANRAWATGQAVLLKAKGAAIARDISATFVTPWPKDKVRVDLVVVANGDGAYTSTMPQLHAVVATQDPRDQGTRGLEILFHETSHGLIQGTQRALDRSAFDGRVVLGDLWHTVLFYSVGEIIKRHFKEHAPYAEVEKLYTGRWDGHLPLLTQHWKPYLDGKATRQQAVDALVAHAIAPPPRDP